MTVPLVKLPSLDLVRGFVAVGRHRSITRAAQELCLTQSAVSRQVLALEESLGIRLLVRSHRAVSFTPEGERFFRAADKAVQQLQDVVGALRANNRRLPVTLTSSIGFAGLWLLPRLGAFQQAHPETDVRISASNVLVDLGREGLDLAIRYCAQASAPLGAVKLFGETLAPVAHPSLGLTSLDSPEALAAHTLLEFEGDRQPWLGWDDWLAGQGWGGLQPRAVLRFNQYDQVIHAALAGQGIAIGRREMIDLMLADGRLVALAAPRPTPDPGYAYWLIQAGASPRPEIQEVVRWILAEAGRTGA
jgi:LysR family glycine cleavage system transcriptional activator